MDPKPRDIISSAALVLVLMALVVLIVSQTAPTLA